MKNSLPILIFILLYAASQVFSQEPSKWLRIETEKGELSVAFPQTNIIDAEKREFGQRFRVIAFENGVEIEVKVSKDGNARERLQRVRDVDNSKSEVFKVGNYLIRKTDPRSLNGGNFYNSLLIAGNGHIYALSVKADTGTEPEAARFLYSIRLGGKQLFVQKQPVDHPEQKVALSEMKTSPEVFEAFNRKPGQYKGEIRYELESKDDDSRTEGLTHSAITLDRPLPRYTPQPLRAGPIRDFSVAVKLKVQFRADGQIGDIIVLSNSDKEFTSAAIDAVRKSVFVPARRGDEYVDSFQMLEFSLQLSYIGFGIPIR
jgi:hypothetical protein